MVAMRAMSLNPRLKYVGLQASCSVGMVVGSRSPVQGFSVADAVQTDDARSTQS